MPVALVRCEAFPVPPIGTVDPHPLDIAHQSHRLQMGPSLNPGAEDGKVGCLLPGQEPGGHARRRSGPYGCDLAGIDDGQRHSVLRVEQHHHALVRVVFGSMVARKDSHDLEAQGLRSLHIARHHAKDAKVVGKPDSRTQWVYRFAA